MPKYPKYIKVGVSEEDHLAMDDKRQAERTEFQELGAYFFHEWLAGRLSSNAKNPAGQSPVAGTLTEDQRDILAILATDPKQIKKQRLAFEAIQTMVKNAIEDYRKEWKPKASKPSAEHDRRPTGT